MIRQRFTLPRYDWRVYAYYIVTKPYADEILDALAHIGCTGEDMARAYDNLMSGKCDTGLTYSNCDTRETVMVFARTTSAKEFQQSYQHEVGHLKDHITQAFGISPHGEELQYIGDDIVDATWEIAKDLLCDCCRKNAGVVYCKY